MNEDCATLRAENVMRTRRWLAAVAFLLSLVCVPLDAQKDTKSRSSSQASTVAEVVWVNTSSHVYHCPGTQYYGNTKYGSFMSEAAARTAGNRPAYGRTCFSTGTNSLIGKSPTPKGTPAATDVQVWVNTGSHVYHCPGTRYYGNTKRGQFMTESAAQAAGNRPAGSVRCN